MKVQREKTMKTYMVERSLKGISMEQLGEAQKSAIDKAAQMTKAGMSVSYLHSTFVPNDGRCMCMFQANDARDVERLNRDCNIPFDKVTEAMHLPPDK
jgi:hypothetical protein